MKNNTNRKKIIKSACYIGLIFLSLPLVVKVLASIMISLGIEVTMK